MALIVAEDHAGPWAGVECDARGCFAHVTVRPVGSGWTPLEIAEEAFALAEDEGWRLRGLTYCPRHAHDRPERRSRLADGFSWARTAAQGVNRSQRPS